MSLSQWYAGHCKEKCYPMCSSSLVPCFKSERWCTRVLFATLHNHLFFAVMVFAHSPYRYAMSCDVFIVAFVAAGGSSGVSALVATAGLSGAMGAHMTGAFQACFPTC